MVRNSAKSNWKLEELNWKFYDKGQLSNWEGLINYFIELSNKNRDYKKSYIRQWKVALQRAKN
jgi:hypothetical protein